VSGPKHDEVERRIGALPEDVRNSRRLREVIARQVDEEASDLAETRDYVKRTEQLLLWIADCCRTSSGLGPFRVRCFELLDRAQGLKFTEDQYASYATFKLRGRCSGPVLLRSKAWDLFEKAEALHAEWLPAWNAWADAAALGEKRVKTVRRQIAATLAYREIRGC
jgi:hypothetical protein